MTYAVRHSMRALLVGFLTVGALLLLAAVASAATYAEAEESFTTKINAERQAAGLGPLSVNVQLTRVARAWAGVMLEQDQLFHNPNLGTQVQGDWSRLGENVGFSRSDSATQEDLVQRIHQAFLDSPPHRANILGDFNQVGVGVLITADNKMWVTVNFMLSPTSPGSGPVHESVAVSRQVFADADGGGAQPVEADFAVIVRSEVFADALGAAALAGDNGPILFTPGPQDVDPDPALHPGTRAELDRVLGGSGTVYLLGGPGAVSDAVARELSGDGYTVRRLAGATRVETSVAVAAEVLAVQGNSGEVIIARADDWADAVTGGAYAAFAGTPVLLTNGDSLHPAVAQFLAQANPAERFVLGGGAAVSESVVAAAGAQRVSGPDRSATAVAIARVLWGRVQAAAGDQYVLIPGFAADGWTYALAYAPYSAVNASPQLLVADAVPGPVVDYVTGLGYSSALPGDVAAASVISPNILDELLRLVGR